eukprot:m.655401 g.655401  ORF g.655401 m.655401 type:complete len:724 (+) comp58418_c0_seq3:117-2288(+)
METWGTEQVVRFVEGLGLATLVPLFRHEGLTGATLATLTDHDLCDKYHITDIKARLALLRAVKATLEPARTNHLAQQQTAVLNIQPYMSLGTDGTRARPSPRQRNDIIFIDSDRAHQGVEESSYHQPRSVHTTTSPKGERSLSVSESSTRVVHTAPSAPQQTLLQKPLESVSAVRLAAEHCTKTGWLQKLGANVKSWKVRWVVVQSGCLYYFATAQSHTPKGALSLNYFIRTERAPDSQRPFSFKIIPAHESDRVWYFSAMSEADLADWIQTIQQTIVAFAESRQRLLMQSFVPPANLISLSNHVNQAAAGPVAETSLPPNATAQSNPSQASRGTVALPASKQGPPKPPPPVFEPSVSPPTESQDNSDDDSDGYSAPYDDLVSFDAVSAHVVASATKRDPPTPHRSQSASSPPRSPPQSRDSAAPPYVPRRTFSSSTEAPPIPPPSRRATASAGSGSPLSSSAPVQASIPMQASIPSPHSSPVSSAAARAAAKLGRPPPTTPAPVADEPVRRLSVSASKLVIPHDKPPAPMRKDSISLASPPTPQSPGAFFSGSTQLAQDAPPPVPRRLSMSSVPFAVPGSPLGQSGNFRGMSEALERTVVATIPSAHSASGDPATPLHSSQRGIPWLQVGIGREQAELMLSREGFFLVRQTDPSAEKVITCLSGGRFLHFKIYFVPTLGFTLGGNDDPKYFKEEMDLIQYYQLHEIPSTSIRIGQPLGLVSD